VTRRPSLLAVALLSWLVCFAVLAELGTWTLFGSQLETAIRRVYDELDGKLSRD